MNQPRDEQLVRLAAKRGAASVTGLRQAISDAATYAVERWEDAMLRGKPVRDLGAWAFRIGANAAQSMAKKIHAQKGRSGPPELELVFAALDAEDGGDTAGFSGHLEEFRKKLAKQLSSEAHRFRGRQLQVLLKMSEPGMSFHLAAKELGMARFNLRRSFYSALRRLQIAASRG